MIVKAMFLQNSIMECIEARQLPPLLEVCHLRPLLLSEVNHQMTLNLNVVETVGKMRYVRSSSKVHFVNRLGQKIFRWLYASRFIAAIIHAE